MCGVRCPGWLGGSCKSCGDGCTDKCSSVHAPHFTPSGRKGHRESIKKQKGGPTMRDRASLRMLRPWRVSQLRRNLVGFVELCPRRGLLSFLMKRQGKVVMCFRVARFEAHSFDELRLRRSDVARLQQYQSEIVVSFIEIRFEAQNFPENIGGAGGIVVLA